MPPGSASALSYKKRRYFALSVQNENPHYPFISILRMMILKGGLHNYRLESLERFRNLSRREIFDLYKIIERKYILYIVPLDKCVYLLRMRVVLRCCKQICVLCFSFDFFDDLQNNENVL